MDLQKLEKWLAENDYELDQGKKVPGFNDTLQNSVNSFTNFIDDESLKWRTRWKDDKFNARVSTTKLPNSNVFTCKWEADIEMSVDDWAQLILLDGKYKISSSWDPSFLEGEFVDVFGNEKVVTEHAKIGFASFAASPLKKRELLSLAVPVANHDNTQINMVCLSLKSDKYKVKKGHERAKNLIISGDRCTILGDGKIKMEHIYTTDLGGWVPLWAVDKFFRKSYINVFVQEFKQVLKLSKSDSFKEHCKLEREKNPDISVFS